MPHKGNISEQSNKISVENAEFTCVGQYDAVVLCRVA